MRKKKRNADLRSLRMNLAGSLNSGNPFGIPIYRGSPTHGRVRVTAYGAYLLLKLRGNS